MAEKQVNALNDFNFKSQTLRHRELLRERENDRLVKQILRAERQARIQKVRGLLNGVWGWTLAIFRRPAAKPTSAAVEHKKVIHDSAT